MPETRRPLGGQFRSRMHRCLQGALLIALLGPAVIQAVVLPPASSPPNPQARTAPTAAQKTTASPPSEATARRIAFSLRDLGLQRPMHLQGIDGSDSVGFGLRRDEVVAAATLRLNYTFSPSLLPELSHLKLYLNEEVIGAIPLPKDQAGTEQHRDIPIDPRYFSDFNQLRLQLIGHYTLECEDALHSSLWAAISARSELLLDVRSIALPDDLALLPAPFFDFRDNRALDLPFVFGGQPTLASLRAAGMLASWFGALADYRPARFPAFIDHLPDRHAIVWAPNDALPAALRLTPADGPGLSILPHPDDNRIKLLVVTGRDAADLETAARALVLGEPGLSGRRAAVSAVRLPERRAAYDAPRWLPSHRPAKLGELVQAPEELQVKTRIPRLIALRVRLPPDLLIWQNDGVPLELHYRYTPPVADDNSTLNVGVNHEFLRSLPLPAQVGNALSGDMVLPVRDDARPFDNAELKLPAFQVHTDNQLQFQFTFDYHKQGLCRSFQLDNVRAAIDPDSTIDVSAFPHYAEMPDLAAFAHVGFPFTKYADLAETSVVLPEPPAPADIEALLFVLGQMGRATGLPALYFGLVGENGVAAAADSDLLLLDATGRLQLPGRWREHLPATIAEGSRTIGRKFGTWPAFRLEDPDQPPDAEPVSQTTAAADGPLAAFFAFESPMTRGRSVVTLTANSAEAAQAALQALADPGRAGSIRGDVTYIRGERVEGFRVGDTYFVGHLPFWTWTWFHVARHPLVLAGAGVLAGFLAAFLAYGGLKRVARQRLQR